MSPTVVDTRRAPGTASSGASVPGPLRAELQRRRSRRRALIRAGLVLVLVLLLAVAGWLVGFSSVLAARTVTVSGQHHVTAAEVRTAAAVPLGVPLARQDLDAVAQRVATLPRVDSVHVVRDWPHTVAVSVVERRPLLAVPQPDGYALVDGHGVAYETSSSIPDGVLRTDADPTATPLMVQLGVVAAALPEGLRGRVTRLQATSVEDITLDLSGGIVVHWGSASESPLKAQVVTALRKKAKTSIDVSAPHNPAVR
ncbi:cell division protein FtsQ/DivIB [uncultured Friedmanniella sp.]|uniref:cell division protein FtsQ/DivIB n=1 Tax=uncultured Friedmanniella sp. TaxID=335381 RepID=UPI0035C97B4E